MDYIYRKLDRIEQVDTPPGWWILPFAFLGLAAWYLILSWVWMSVQ